MIPSSACRASSKPCAPAMSSWRTRSAAAWCKARRSCRFCRACAEHLLGEKLKLPSVATWWCGQKAAREHVLENLDRLVVKPAFRTHLKIVRSREPERIAIGALNLIPTCLSRRSAWSFPPRRRGTNGFARRAAGQPPRFSGGGRQRRLLRDARRAGARVAGQRREIHFHAARRQQQGHLDSLRHARRGNHAAARHQSKRRTAPHRKQPAVAPRGQFFLARPLFRTRGRHARLLRSALRRFNPERTGGALPLLAPLLQTLETQGQLPGISAKPELWAERRGVRGGAARGDF